MNSSANDFRFPLPIPRKHCSSISTASQGTIANGQIRLEVSAMKLSAGIGISFLLFIHLSLIAFAQSGVITTYAGQGLATNGVLASGQPIGTPSSIAVDNTGGFYVAINSQHLVYYVTADGRISVVAGNGTLGFSGDGGGATSAQLLSPSGLALDAGGNLFISDSGNNRIRKVTPDGIISTLAGTGTADSAGDSGPAALADLNYPIGLAADGAGNLFIADSSNNRVRKISPVGIITTLAGTGAGGFSGDTATATLSQLDHPTGVAVDAAGNVFIADSGNQRIREITTDGNINTIAGNGIRGYGGDGGQATSAEFNNPAGLALDSAGNLYIADSYNYRVRKLEGGTITTIAGNGTAGFSGDNGSATSAALYLPISVSVETSGNLFIADYVSLRVRKVTGTGVISTVAGTGIEGFSGDGGLAASALLYLPTGVGVDSAGSLFIADSSNARVRKVTTGGVISTVAGSGNQGSGGDGGQATSAGLKAPSGVAVDASGNLFIADYLDQRVRKVTPGGVISTVAGTGVQGYSGDGGPATAAQLNEPWGLAVDASGNLFVADLVNHCIRMVTPDGVISTMAGIGKPGFSGDGTLAAFAQLTFPVGVAVDSSGNLFIADSGNHRIRKVNSAGIISTVAGNGIAGFSGDGNPATSAQLNGPTGVTVDSGGNLFIVDHRNNRIREVTSDGIIHTIAGTGTPGFSGDGGPATSAQLSAPMGMAVDSSGDLFIADYDNDRIRKIMPQNSTASYFAQVAIGSGYSTLFSISNAGSTAASGVLRLTDPRGEPLSVSFTLEDSDGTTLASSSGSTFLLAVPSGKRVLLSAKALADEAPVQVGWGNLESTSGLLNGTALYEYSAGSTLQEMVDAFRSPLSQSATFAVDNDAGQNRQIAYAIANPGNQAISIQLTLVGQDGRATNDSTMLRLGPKEQIARYLWMDLACSNFKGSLVLQGQAGASFIAEAILDDQGLLTAIPVTSGSAQ
jgi:sugar lactone lactonase YvrE